MGIFLYSCEDEMLETEPEKTQLFSNHEGFDSIEGEEADDQHSLDFEFEGVHDFKIKKFDAVEPSDCEATPFNEVSGYYSNLLISDFVSLYSFDPLEQFLILDQLFLVNRILAVDGINADYFGANGEFTQYVNKDVRKLEKFWGSNEIAVLGQHTETLEDMENIRYVYENYSTAPEALIEYYLSIYEYFIENGSQIPENPFYASDGFASSLGYIVIGDGLVQMISEIGFDPKVVWSSILAHEWGHQLQFANFGNWQYPTPPFNGTPESTRMTELEADFLTGFYLTHKRGGTFNWKRIEDVLGAFYNIGDCSFESSGHHGTPDQRLASAEAGYEAAVGIKKKGHLPTQDEVHDLFLEFYYTNY